MKRRIQFVGSLVLGCIVLYAVLHRVDARQTMMTLSQARFSHLILGFTLMVFAYVLRGERWRIWESGLTYWDSLRLILIGFMGNNLLPARLGEILRAHCTTARTSKNRGRTAALASIAAERILDGLVLAVTGLVALAIVPMDRHLQWPLFLLSVAFAGLASALVFGVRYHENMRSLIAAANRKFPGHMTTFAQQKASHCLDGLLPLGRPQRVVSAIAMTMFIWGVETASYYYIGLSVWHGMSVHIALLLLVVTNFASLIPLTIGGIGTIEAVALTFLASAAVPPNPALAMVLLQHAFQYVFTTVSGGVFYLTGAFYRTPLTRSKAPASRLPDEAALRLIEETRSNLNELGEFVKLRPGAFDAVELSIVIPAYNELARLPRTVLETLRWCVNQKLNFELIIADDGSEDGTLALAHLFEESDGRIRVLACPHMGKGATVRMGMLNAKGRSILFMDADGATPLPEISKLLTATTIDQYDVAIGSRVAQREKDIQVSTSLHRKFIGRVFALFVNLFAIDGIGDTQCGFKIFRREAALAIFSRQKLVGFAFDVEILFLARRLSLSVVEIPVNWAAQAGSKVNIITDSIKMLWDICHIRWIHRNLDRESVAYSAVKISTLKG